MVSKNPLNMQTGWNNCSHDPYQSNWSQDNGKLGGIGQPGNRI